MRLNRFIKKFITLILSLLICFNLPGCSSENPGSISGDDTIDPNGSTLVENKLYETILSESYLKEFILVENKVSELLIQDDKIKEVLLCETIYVPQDSISEFSKNSQTAKLFGEGIDLAPLLAKIAIGTGVILTLTILSVSGLEGPVGSIVAAAAPAALKGAAMGAATGTVIGGLTGAADEVDQSGISSAVIGFSVAVVGVVMSIVSAVLAFPSGGSTAASVVFGIKIAIAGIALASAAVSGYNMVKKITTTEAKDIDWQNINWNKVGVSAAEQSINGAADGYVWGSVIGAIEGGLEGLKVYEEFGTPYSKYNARLAQSPKEGSGGHWTGQRGESKFVLDEPIKCKNGAIVKEITYKNCVPDFSDFSLRQVTISGMTNNRSKNFAQADKILAEYWSKTKFGGKASWSARDVSNYRSQNGLTWHEMNNMKTMQLVPSEVNGTFGHLGGVGEYNAMIGQKGGNDFD